MHKRMIKIPDHCTLCTNPPCHQLAECGQRSIWRRDLRWDNIRKYSYSIGSSYWADRIVGECRSIFLYWKAILLIHRTGWLIIPGNLSYNSVRATEEVRYLYNSRALALSDTPSTCERTVLPIGAIQCKTRSCEIRQLSGCSGRIE